jgi:hypothetical protein
MCCLWLCDWDCTGVLILLWQELCAGGWWGGLLCCGGGGVVFLCFNILTDNIESVSYLLNQPIACVRLNRYIIEYTQQDAKYENEDDTVVHADFSLSQQTCGLNSTAVRPHMVSTEDSLRGA